MYTNILKDDAVKVLHSICQQIWKTQQWSQYWKRSVFTPIPKKGNAKGCSNYCTIVLISQSTCTGEGNGKSFLYYCLENPMNSMKRLKDRTLKYKLPRSVGAQHATGDQWRNNSRKNEGMEPNQKHPVVDVTGDGSKVRYCKEQHCIGTWNVRSMNQGKLEVVKQEMARMKTDILGISKLN